jgi:hypothetical protein
MFFEFHVTSVDVVPNLVSLTPTLHLRGSSETSNALIVQEESKPIVKYKSLSIDIGTSINWKGIRISDEYSSSYLWKTVSSLVG